MSSLVPTLVYLLCFLTSSICALLLGRSYARTRSRLLLWSAICFCLLALANVLDSMSRGRAACQAGLQRQTLRSIRSGRRAPDPVSLIEGVIRFNAEAWRACAICPRAAGRRGLMRASWRRSRR